jgi:hypothetical protein
MTRTATIPALFFVACMLSMPSLPLFAGDEDLSDSRIVWRPNTGVKFTEKIFPSPHDPDHVIIATRDGLVQTFDNAQTWALIPNTGREVLGRISDLCYSPYDENQLYLGSKDKGVFRSTDGGKTWVSAGTVEAGLIALRVVRLACQPGDRSFSTFYALHGADVAGMSKTIDGGKTWTKIAERYNFSDIVLRGTEFFMSGRLIEEEDVWSVYSSVDGGRFWKERTRNAQAGAGAASHISQDRFWFGIQGGRILDGNGGVQHFEKPWEFRGPESGDWQSLFTTFADHPDQELMFAYDPHGLGLIMSKDSFNTWQTENDGLFINRLVKEGANVYAPATGETFYASINGQLYVGRRMIPDLPAISRTKAKPAIVRVPYNGYLEASGELHAKLRELSEARHAGRLAAKMHKTVTDLSNWSSTLSVNFTVRVTPSDETRKITSVSIDLSPLLGPDNAEMFDDGKHGDGAAGDGVYGVSFDISPRCFDRYAPDDHGPKIPGQTALSITATDNAGKNTTAVVLVSVYPKAENFTFWSDTIRHGFFNMSHEGECTLSEVETQPHTGTHSLHVSARQGPWTGAWTLDFNPRNISDADCLTFWIKAPPAAGRDIKVALQTPGYGSEAPNFTNEVWLMKEGYLKERKDEYQLVKVPLNKLFAVTGFQTDQCGGIIFGGSQPDGDDFYVDDIGFEVNEKK